MHTALDLLENGDPCSAVLLVSLLVFLGAKIVSGHPRLHSWGLRTAVCAFIGFCAWRYIDSPTSDPNDLLAVVLRGLLAGGLALGVTWILLPVFAFLHQSAVASPLEKARRWIDAATFRAAERRRRRDEEARRRREREEYERAAPERERARREAQARGRSQAEAQRRREEARAACDALFYRHATDIAARYDRTAFDEWFTRHLGDEHPADYVEQHARQLQDLIRHHLELLRPRPATRAQEAASARLHVERFYDDHAALLRDVYPPALFAATLKALILDTAEPADVWKAASDYLGKLQDVVSTEKAKAIPPPPKRRLNPDDA